MIEGKKEILEYFVSIGKPYFALFYTKKVESGNAIRRNDKEEKDYDLTEGKECLERILLALSYGDYTLIINDTKDVTKRGHLETNFRIPLNESNNTNNNVAAVGAIVGTGITKEEAERIADERFAKLMMESENKTLKEKLVTAEKEVKELEGKVSKPLSDAIGAIAPHFPAIINSWIGAPQVIPQLAISGAAPSSIGEGDEAHQQEIFQNFVTALSTARPTDWLEIIQKLTVLAANNNKLEMALKFI
jgi:hypothetical protein